MMSGESEITRSNIKLSNRLVIPARVPFVPRDWISPFLEIFTRFDKPVLYHEGLIEKNNSLLRETLCMFRFPHKLIT